jgi:hypothetical protein
VPTLLGGMQWSFVHIGPEETCIVCEFLCIPTWVRDVLAAGSLLIVVAISQTTDDEQLSCVFS